MHISARSHGKVDITMKAEKKENNTQKKNSQTTCVVTETFYFVFLSLLLLSSFLLFIMFICNVVSLPLFVYVSTLSTVHRYVLIRDVTQKKENENSPHVCRLEFCGCCISLCNFGNSRRKRCKKITTRNLDYRRVNFAPQLLIIDQLISNSFLRSIEHQTESEVCLCIQAALLCRLESFNVDFHGVRCFFFAAREEKIFLVSIQCFLYTYFFGFVCSRCCQNCGALMRVEPGASLFRFSVLWFSDVDKRWGNLLSFTSEHERLRRNQINDNLCFCFTFPCRWIRRRKEERLQRRKRRNSKRWVQMFHITFSMMQKRIWLSSANVP